MIISVYSPGNSFLHQLKPGIKLFMLIAITSGIFIFPSLMISIISLALSIGLYIGCQLPAIHFTQLVKRSVFFLIVLFILHFFNNTLIVALTICIRLSAVLIFATIFTLTTRISDMIDTVEKALSFIKRFGVNPKKISLSISLAIRFIPLLFEITSRVREAQSVRGAGRNIFAIIIPSLVLMFKTAEELTQALDARGYDCEPLSLEDKTK
ncbi:energy-coupling factor transporter transmembrane component T family protein [Thorsellia anophelis]|uniref:Biotin transport system permease protein n=1 Tax=Thorsellia anophelis DSM 18579 TaxID=1123402 RepID=A0A1H9YN85_9GAMM|nr:energy-coupling factor transporter transmembrane component T [Thorsellia anophelis]SES70556.1 biotin transport system permease protein [Thorsellia anophelis DSM 18579]